MSLDLSFSADSAPQAERFDAWREFNLGAFGILFEPHKQPHGCYAASVDVRLRGELGLFCYNTEGAHVVRGVSQIARRSWNGYFIYRERDGSARYFNSLSEVRTKPGAIGVSASDNPWEGWADARYNHDVLVVPKALLDAHLPALARPVFATLADAGGFAALAAEYFHSLTRQWDALDAGQAEIAAGVLCRLIGVALGARADAEPAAVAAGRFAQAKRYVERRLAEPNLNAASAAAALRVSERTLQDVFAQCGASFAAYVRRRRLEECRAALVANPSRSIADIAFASGFNSLASFYRAFAAEFGASPGELRERGSSGARPPASDEETSCPSI